MTKFIFTLFILIIISLKLIFSQENQKIPLDHSVYNSWKELESFSVSNNGENVSYQIDPQVGDGWLFVENVITDNVDSFPRAYSIVFSQGSEFAAFKIKPEYEKLRKMKLDKVKSEKLPKDSLGIILIKNDSLIKRANIKSFNVPVEKSQWITILYDKSEEKKVTEDSGKKKRSKKQKLSEEIERKKVEKDKKQTGTRLEIFNPLTNENFAFENISEYSVSRSGNLVAFISVVKDSIDTSYVFAFNTTTKKIDTVLIKNGLAKKIDADNNGKQIAYIHSEDTCKEKTFSLYFWDDQTKKSVLIVDTLCELFPHGWTISEYGSMYFSRDDSRLFFGIAEKPEKEKKDSLLDEEKYKLDIWHYEDPNLQSQQIKDLKTEKNRSYLTVYHIKQNKVIQLGDTVIQNIILNQKGNGKYAIGFNPVPYAYITQWLLPSYRDYYLINVETGENIMIAEKSQSFVNLSDAGKFIYWFDINKQTWFSMLPETNNPIVLTKNIPVNFFNEEMDMPEKPGSYGIAGWTENDKYVLIYDLFDIWRIDPLMQEEPVCMTNGYGRKNMIKFKYIKLDPEAEFINSEEELLLSGFNEKNKAQGFFNTFISGINDPVELICDDCRYGNPVKSKETDRLLWTKSDFLTYPVLHLSDIHFNNIRKFREVNPQQKNYLWGCVELVEWKTLKNDTNQGLLYKPENFDPLKKYPMIVYFYERYSDFLHAHYTPRPSRSVINFPYYVSNDYLIFIPDIHYNTGSPGQDAYDAVITGTDYLISRGFVDEMHLGLQGQSWGGYQVAFLITQTNKYQAAMAGAPVSNMTSAYGGIRWESGVSRQFQYEVSQSRIGTTLWEDLDLYINNSPVFFADKVNTPLLIMHNDNDGAVPWYQSIEYFLALRRLGKPVWMLTYNSEEHNLIKRPNCVDLSIRMSQFFDHFLKDKAAPEWMVKGIPAVNKGNTDAYQLIGE
ncbi:MAG: prolyl oligopeptidase family serine peptidase [Bacteroidota bacterium]